MKTDKIRKIAKGIAGNMVTFSQKRLDSGTVFLKIRIHARNYGPMCKVLIDELNKTGVAKFERGHYANDVVALVKPPAKAAS